MNNTKPNINVTPLIDVLLVLLIIFMVVSPLKPANFKTKIPQENENSARNERYYQGRTESRRFSRCTKFRFFT